jgi:hypothetical protein
MQRDLGDGAVGFSRLEAIGARRLDVGRSCGPRVGLARDSVRHVHPSPYTAGAVLSP